MRTIRSRPVLGSAVAAGLLLLGCDRPTNAPTEPEASTSSASVRPQAIVGRGAYDLTKVPAKFFAAPGARAPRGYGATPTLSRSELEAQARASVVVNGSFERNGGVGSNDFAGWTVVDNPEGQGSWFAQTGAASPLSGFIAFIPPRGQFAAMTDQSGPGTHILYQDVRVPQGHSTLSFKVSLFNQAGAYFAPHSLSSEREPNQQFRMDIMAPLAKVDGLGPGVLRNVFLTEPGDPPLQGYTTIRASLTEFAGRTVRLRFAEVDNQGFFQVGIDQVRITVE